MFTQHPQDRCRGRVLALLLTLGDHEFGRDVAQAEALIAMMEGAGEHSVVCDAGTADGPAPGAGGLGQCRRVQAAVQALVLVDDEGGRDPGGP